MICLFKNPAEFMFNLFRLTREECGLALGVVFSELDRIGLSDNGIRRMFFNVAVILRYNAEITRTGRSA